jgi:glucosamine--fructose-6-phosphate aminotransferase (isomerizing)
MCGIVGGVANKDITSFLLDGLYQLEYRGYDSSGLIVLSKNNVFNRARSVGKVKNLEII